MYFKSVSLRKIFNSGDSFPWLLGGSLYTISWGWSFFFLNAFFWDDWRFFYDKSGSEQVALWSGEAKHFINPFLNPLVLQVGIWPFRVLGFALMFGSGVFLFEILRAVKFLSVQSAKMVVLIFLVVPINPARYALQNFEYLLSYFCFFLAWYLLVSKKDLLSRLFSLSFFLVAFGTPSFLSFFALPILHASLIGDLTSSTKSKFAKITNWSFRHLDFVSLPFLFWVIFQNVLDKGSQYGGSKYGYSHAGTSLAIRAAVISILLIFILNKTIKSKETVDNPRPAMQFGIFACWLALFPYLATGNFTDVLSWFTVLLPSSGDWGSRHELLLPLGASFILFSVIKALRPVAQLPIFSVLISALILVTAMTGASYYVDTLKQSSVVNIFRDNEQKFANTEIFIHDDATRFNAKNRVYRSSEWTGLLDVALGDRAPKLIGSSRLGIFPSICLGSPATQILIISPTDSWIKALTRRHVELSQTIISLELCPGQ